MSETLIDQALGNLMNSSHNVRRAAALVLGAAGERRAVDSLTRAIKDEYWQVRYAAVESLGKLGDGRAVDSLAIALADGVSWVRFAALQAMKNIGLGQSDTGKLAGRLIKAVVEEPYDHIRKKAEEALDAIATAQGVHPFQQIEPMLILLADDNPVVRLLAMEKLNAIADSRAVPAFIVALGDSEVRVRKEAIAALGKVGDTAGVAPLLKIVQDEDTFIRRAVIGSLGRIGDGKAIGPVFRMLGDVDPQVRQVATVALDAIGKKQGIHPFQQIEHLLEAANDVSAKVRKIALGKIIDHDDFRSDWALRWALKDSEGEIIALAIKGLIKKQEAYALFDLHEMKEKVDKKSPLAQQLAKAFDQLKPAAKNSLLLQQDRPVCRNCLRRFHMYKLKTGFMSSISFYGCRLCGLARNRLEGIGIIVAVMDTPWKMPYRQEGNTLFINMCMREKNKNYLVDFDILEIHHASYIDLNEEVKYLLMRSGYDITMTPEKMKTIPVRLVNNPKLIIHSLNLLNNKMKQEFTLPEQDEDGRYR